MADGMMSPSDVAVMMKDNDGWGNGMGFMWIFALLILANGGFSGWGGNGFANAIGYENLATSNEVQRGFDNQNSMANQRETLAAVNAGALQAIQNSNQNTQYITGQVMDKYNELERDIQTIALGQQQAIANQTECCCNTLRAIDGVNFNNAMNTASINANTSAQAQRIIDYLTNSDMQRLRDENQTLRTAQMLDPIQNRLNMVPTYPNSFAYNAGPNPFCPSGCGCGGSF